MTQQAPVEQPEQQEEATIKDSLSVEKQNPFDWKTSDDASELKAFAMKEFGLEIKGNKKADTVRSEIEGFLEAGE